MGCRLFTLAGEGREGDGHLLFVRGIAESQWFGAALGVGDQGQGVRASGAALDRDLDGKFLVVGLDVAEELIGLLFSLGQ